LALINVQNYLAENNVAGAIAIIETLIKSLEQHPEKRFMPGLVALIAGLYTMQSRNEKAKAELEAASNYWRSTTSPDPAGLIAAGTAALATGNPQDQTTAAAIFSELVSNYPNPLSNAGYVASHPTKQLQSEVSQLTPVKTLLKDINVDKLLESGVALPPAKKRSLDEALKSKASQQAPRKKRKIRLPKGEIDPDKKPDPERWLPLRDRSTYKPKGKKDKKRQRDLTQGGFSTEREEDTEMIGGNSVTKVTPAQASAAAKNKNKKKGKGKK